MLDTLVTDVGGNLADDVAQILLEILEVCGTSLEVQKWCLERLRKLCKTCGLCLSLVTWPDGSYPEIGIFSDSTRDAVLAACDQSVSSFPEDEELHSIAYRVLARTRRLPELFTVIEHKSSLLKVVLDEVFSDLRWGWIKESEWGKQLLLQVSRQCVVEDSSPAMVTAADWVRQVYQTSQYDEQKLECALSMVGLLFDNGRLVARGLCDEVDEHVQQRTFDEGFITASIRSLIGLQGLGVLGADLQGVVLRKIRLDKFRPQERRCNSAWVGILGAFTAREPTGEAEPIVGEILKTARWWMSKHRAEGLIYEAVWALRVLLEADDTLARCCANKCLVLVSDIEKDRTYSMEYEEECTRDARNAAKEAQKLKETIIPFLRDGTVSPFQ